LLPPIAIAAAKRAFATSKRAFATFKRAFATFNRAFATSKRAFATFNRAISTSNRAIGTSKRAFATSKRAIAAAKRAIAAAKRAISASVRANRTSGVKPHGAAGTGGMPRTVCAAAKPLLTPRECLATRMPGRLNAMDFIYLRHFAGGGRIGVPLSGGKNCAVSGKTANARFITRRKWRFLRLSRRC
jgi:hypothetical protein